MLLFAIVIGIPFLTLLLLPLTVSHLPVPLLLSLESLYVAVFTPSISPSLVLWVILESRVSTNVYCVIFRSFVGVVPYVRTTSPLVSYKTR